MAVITIIDFVPNRIELDDWAIVSKEEWMHRAGQALNPGVDHLRQATLPLIQKVSQRWIHSTHTMLSIPLEEKTSAEADYERLQGIIYSFLGERMSWDLDGYSTLFGKPIAKAQLSAGQRVLLQLCVAIYAQGGSITSHIVFMDEPENHLHPSSVVDFIDHLSRINSSGQIWIATHSIPLLSHFESSSLWYVVDGSVRFSGKNPEIVLRSLLGDDERINRLRDFIDLPEELACARFALECLLPPNVVDSVPNDPQTTQLAHQLRIWKDRESIKILDFGAGKGRMITNLVDHPEVPMTKIDYYAFDPFQKDMQCCIDNISMVFSDASRRYFGQLDEIRSKCDDHCFDVVVLSNVLHEVPYTGWKELIDNIWLQLRQDGFLLLIEDCRLPNGELPHQGGFLVLSSVHLRKLFKIRAEAPGFVAHDARLEVPEQRGRLMAHLISAEYLPNVSMDTIRDAIVALKRTSVEEIRKCRRNRASYSNGRTHGFWVQQLANATLAMTEMGIEGQQEERLM